MKKQHFQTILKAGTAILVCSMVLAGCGTKNQKNATANITTAGNTALEQPMRLETLKDDGTDLSGILGNKDTVYYKRRTRILLSDTGRTDCI